MTRREIHQRLARMVEEIERFQSNISVVSNSSTLSSTETISCLTFKNHLQEALDSINGLISTLAQENREAGYKGRP
jgi:septation ring formation regulator EzrA